MIQAIIIDDEQHCSDHLSRLLAAYFPDAVQVQAVCASVEEGLAAIRRFSPQLVFLDVQIREQTGFDLLRALPAVSFDVVFTTAFDKYAVQAFKFSAIDYLLKPIDPDDLAAAVKRVEAKVSAATTAGKLDVLFHNLQHLQGASKRICVPVQSGLVFLSVSDIIRCESQVNYTTLFLKDRKKLVVAKTLKEFEEMLGDYQFFRVHNSHLINLSYIESFHKSDGGFVTMSDQSTVAVSSRRKEDFLKRLGTL